MIDGSEEIGDIDIAEVAAAEAEASSIEASVDNHSKNDSGIALDLDVSDTKDKLERVAFDSDDVVVEDLSLLSPQVTSCLAEIKPYINELTTILKGSENLKLQWLDKQYNISFYKRWEHTANHAFRKIILMRWRRQELIKRLQTKEK